VQPSLGSGLATLTPHASRDEMMHFFGCLDLGLSIQGHADGPRNGNGHEATGCPTGNVGRRFKRGCVLWHESY
jgi:hypothetical protein